MRNFRIGSEKDAKILVELVDTNNWGPNLTMISKRTGIPVSTVFDTIKRLRNNKILDTEFIVRLKLKK